VVDILVTGSLLITDKEVVRDGFVYIRNGRILDYGGGGPPPEEYTYATLILGGPGRIIAPGLTAIIDAPAYHARFAGPSLRERVDLYKSLDEKTALLASLPAVYEAHLAGVTRIIVEYLSPSLPISLESRVGGLYGLAAPVCAAKRLPETPASIHIAGEGCEGDAPIRVEGEEAYSDEGPVLALLRRTAYTLLPGDAYERSMRLRRLLGFTGGIIEKERVAEIAVYNVARPPAMFLDYAPDDLVRRIHASGARVESVISGDTVVVDQGDHLYIVERDFREARRVLSSLLERR